MSYDQWKTTPPDDWYGECEEEDDGPNCRICLDEGWELDENDHVIPCTNCSRPLMAIDLEGFYEDDCPH